MPDAFDTVMTHQSERKTIYRDKTGRSVRRTAAAVFVFLLLGLLIAFAPAFRLQTVSLPDELRKINPVQLEAASQLRVGQHLFQDLGGSVSHLFSLRYGPVEDRILKAFPVVKNAVVRMDWPGTIQCEIVERIEVAWLSVPDGYVMIDKEGIAIEIWTQEPDEIPVIEGLLVQSMMLGSQLTVDVPDALSRAISLLGAIIEADQDQRPDTGLLSQVKSIRPVSGRQLYLTLSLPDSGDMLTVLSETGSDQVDDMLWLRFAMDQHVLSDLGKGVLDLTGDRKTFLPDG